MQFTFADSQGNMVLATTSDLNETQPLGYSYRPLLTPPGTAQPTPVASTEIEPSGSPAASAGATGEAQSVTLGAEPTTIEVALPDQL